MNSSTVSAWQQALATQYNNLRKDIIVQAGEYKTSTGSANAYVLAIDAQYVAYTAGDKFIFNANHTNTGSATLNVNALWAKTLKDTSGNTLTPNSILSWTIVECIYNWTDMIVNSWLSYFSNFYFWDWSDGDVTISSNTTLTRDMYYNNLTVNTGITLNPSGYAIYVRWTLTLNWTGKIIRNWNDWSAWSSATGWAWGNALSKNTCWINLWGWAGWNGISNNNWSVWTDWTSANPSYATTGTVWANWWSGWSGVYLGWAWGTGWTATQWILYNALWNFWKLMSYIASPSRWLETYIWLPSAWGGGAWSGWSWNSGGGGGGAWWNWGNIFVYANIIAWSWTIESKWWNGWNGGTTWSTWSGWGGGWAGWSGWTVILVYRSWTPWTITLTGGSGWTGWAGWSGWSTWTTWPTWTTWQSILITV